MIASLFYTVVGIAKIQGFWDVTPCRLVAVKDIAECRSLYLQCRLSQNSLFLRILLHHDTVLRQYACSHVVSLTMIMQLFVAMRCGCFRETPVRSQ